MQGVGSVQAIVLAEVGSVPGSSVDLVLWSVGSRFRGLKEGDTVGAHLRMVTPAAPRYA